MSGQLQNNFVNSPMLVTINCMIRSTTEGFFLDQQMWINLSVQISNSQIVICGQALFFCRSL